MEQWAIESLNYLANARSAREQNFNNAIEQVREYSTLRGKSVYNKCKEIIINLRDYSSAFVAEPQIPCEQFASSGVFETKLTEYSELVKKMALDLDREDEEYKDKNNIEQTHLLIAVARAEVTYVAEAIKQVQSRKNYAQAENSVKADVDLLVGLARRFHESVLSLKKHPHNGTVYTIGNEWDCQYFFRAILAAYLADVREEEWSPSVAGSATRCEFFLKNLCTFVELKFVHTDNDGKKIKQGLADDILNYGNNPNVEYLICLIYDPACLLKNPSGFQADLSGPKTGLKWVHVVISPPRD